MPTTRRQFVIGTAASLAATAWEPPPRVLAAAPQIKALAFDALAILDPRPVFALADAMFPGAGLSDEWRTRQFEYTWLRVAAQHYADFWRVTADALVFATNKLKIRLRADDRATLMNAYLGLKAWPDAVAALQSMKASGVRLALLSNFTRTMLDANIKGAALDGMFEQVLSTDQAATYKPDPRAYQLGPDALTLTRDDILFVAFAGWDAAGAKLFGYPTYWVNRQKLPAEEIGGRADWTGETLTDLVTFVNERRRSPR